MFVSAPLFVMFVILDCVDLITESLCVCVCLWGSRESLKVSVFAVSVNFSNVLYSIFVLYAMLVMLCVCDSVGYGGVGVSQCETTRCQSMTARHSLM